MIVSRIILFILLALGFTVRQFSSQEMEEFLRSVPYRCPLRWVTGWKCAFCGMTHSWFAIFRGDFAEAFRENLFGPVLFVVSVGLLVATAFGKNIKFGSLKLSTYVLLFGLMIYAVIRNLM